MADARRSPLADRLPWLPPDRAVSLTEQRFLRQLELRMHIRGAYLAGLPVPLEPNRVAAIGGVRTLWLGPDHYLVTAPDGTAPELPARLARAAAGQHASLLDLSSSRIAIELSGSRARSLLGKGCGLDLHPRAFAPGQCAQTLFARAQIILDQLDAAPSYRIFVRASFARYLCDWLIDAAGQLRFTS